MNGSYFFELVKDLYRSNQGATCFKTEGGRELDWLVSTAPMEDIKLEMPWIRELSDHNIVCVSFRCDKLETTALIPNKKLISELSKAIINGEIPSPEILHHRLASLATSGDTIMKRVRIVEKWQKDIDKKEVQHIGNKEEREKYLRKVS